MQQFSAHCNGLFNKLRNGASTISDKNLEGFCSMQYILLNFFSAVNKTRIKFSSTFTKKFWMPTRIYFQVSFITKKQLS